MTSADSYRRMAAEFRSKAARASNAKLAAEMENLARSYVRLAEQADNNSLQDAWFEFGPKSRVDGEGNGT